MSETLNYATGETKTGICLGGPKDGQLITSKRVAYETAVAAHLPLDPKLGSIGVPVSEMAIRKVTYRYVDFPSPNLDNEKMGFWICDEAFPTGSNLILQVIALLVQGYRKPLDLTR